MLLHEQSNLHACMHTRPPAERAYEPSLSCLQLHPLFTTSARLCMHTTSDTCARISHSGVWRGNQDINNSPPFFFFFWSCFWGFSSFFAVKSRHRWSTAIVAVRLKIQPTPDLLTTLQLKWVLMHPDYKTWNWKRDTDRHVMTEGQTDFIKCETNRKFIWKPSCVM